MYVGKVGLGIVKHRTSGNAGRSPKFKMQTLLNARKSEENKPKKKPLPFNSVIAAFKTK
jgi:hypothetical protein